jgi:alcohol dehydrogenase YqhD (iron-dependent ADH family)
LVTRFMNMDPRFKNIEEKDREEIFQDFLDDLLNKEREDKRVEYEQKIEALKVHYGELGIPTSAKWLEVSKKLKEDKD